MGITVKLDAVNFIKWATELSAYTVRLAAKSGLNKASRAARTAAIEMISLDEGVSSARAKRSISALSTASPSRLVTTWTAAKAKVGIMNTSGATVRKGVGLRASTHRVTGGGSSHLNVEKAFLLRANGGVVVVVRKGKGRNALHGIYAENPNTAMAQAGGAARKVWEKVASVRLQNELTASVQAVLSGGMPSSDSGSNN
ncbi:hypothetical protein FNL56_21510 [Tardiphaga sp. vice304]|uniref:hypothetical protein n=1 Tax=Tardiphaga sp. vice304 TaxID=2592817 RepID=UPI00116477B4|nr:hypothetical protein [Tardiphaga sp. vice304]QDM28401.1 hypothetical protein FNL56_21510 [Tardiphaga sp. vice304]